MTIIEIIVVITFLLLQRMPDDIEFAKMGK